MKYNLFDFFKSKHPESAQAKKDLNQIEAFAFNRRLFFNGEKNKGVMGLPFNMFIDYYTMANYANYLYYTTDITRICIDRLVQFAVGVGLKFQYQPNNFYLKKKYNIEIDRNTCQYVESIYRFYTNNKTISYDGQKDITSLCSELLQKTKLCGDCLVVKRIVNGNVKIQLIDGRCIVGIGKVDNGNTLIDGVEINNKGEHVAYHVITDNNNAKTERIKARDKYGNLMAWLVYANDVRVNNVRGLSELAPLIQRIKQLSNYVENEVMASEVNAKFATIEEHTVDSDGAGVIQKQMGRSLVKDGIPEPKAEDLASQQAIERLTNGLHIKVGTGKTLKSFDTKRPTLNFTQFLETNLKLIFASQSIPYEVALMLFSNNFSASRGALKMFENTLNVIRKSIIIDNFLKIVFESIFLLENLKNNVIIPKFDLLRSNNEIGYLNQCYFVSAPIPHVDPLKEVNSVKVMVDNNFITREQAMEMLGNKGDFDNTMEEIKRENDLMIKLNIKETKNMANNNTNNNTNNNINNNTNDDDTNDDDTNNNTNDDDNIINNNKKEK